MPSSLEQLTTLHSQIIGVQPTEDQQRLYVESPKFRGFSDADLNPARFEAVVLLALSLSARVDGRVLVFAPKAHERWVIDQFNALSDRIFTRCKSIGGEPKKRIELARAYKTMFGRLLLTGRLLQLSDIPEHWVSFGFQRRDPLPDWVPEHLLEP